MIRLEIPGIGDITLKHVVFDVNGTLAVDGNLLPGVPGLMKELGKQLTVHLLTADTHGKQSQIDRELELTAVRIQPGNEAKQKADFVTELGAGETVSVGQGANDALMLGSAVIGICLLSPEGTALETLLQADLIVPDIQSALELLLNPIRLKASLRK